MNTPVQLVHQGNYVVLLQSDSTIWYSFTKFFGAAESKNESANQTCPTIQKAKKKPVSPKKIIFYRDLKVSKTIFGTLRLIRSHMRKGNVKTAKESGDFWC